MPKRDANSSVHSGRRSGAGMGRPARRYSRDRKRVSKGALCATSVRPRSALLTSSATAENGGAVARSASLMWWMCSAPCRPSSGRVRQVKVSVRAPSPSAWTTANSITRSRVWSSPVVSVSTTAKRMGRRRRPAGRRSQMIARAAAAMAAAVPAALLCFGSAASPGAGSVAGVSGRFEIVRRRDQPATTALPSMAASIVAAATRAVLRVAPRR
jgi:hypothetical protein